MNPLPTPTFIPRYLSPQAPSEWFGHLAFTHDLLAELRPSLLVQTGTLSGDSYFGFCQSVVEHGLDCVCYGALPSGEESSALASYNSTHYQSFSYLLDSDDANHRFSENSIDLLHIASHAAFDIWLPRVKPGGFVLIDGIADRDTGKEHWRLWEQIEHTFPEHFAFHHGGGLGVLRKPDGQQLTSSLLLALFSDSTDTREYVRRHYVIYSGYLDRVLHTDGATHGLNKKLEELTTELRAALHERMFLETELKQTQFERNDARRTVDHVQASFAAFRTVSEARESQQQEEIQRLTRLLQSERDVIHSLMHSLSWQVTAPLRSVTELLRTRKKA